MLMAWLIGAALENYSGAAVGEITFEATPVTFAACSH
jgi:hypothetical protein